MQLGAFVVGEPLGRGGMGEVWSGHHAATGAPVAIKVITAELAMDPAFQSAFHREVEAVARLDHPGIVTVFDYGSVPRDAAVAAAGTPYLVMEALTGGSLRRRPPGTWHALRDLMLALLDALGYAHARGVVHRDLKLGNVLYAGSRSARPGLRLIDFGVAAAASRGRASSAIPTAGTPMFMAPEQVVGAVEDEGPWTDLYALGCMAYLLAGGSPPFRGSRQEIFRGHLTRAPPRMGHRIAVPPGFEAWVMRLLAKRPRQRWSFAADAAAALRELGDVADRWDADDPVDRDFGSTVPDGPPSEPTVRGGGLVAVAAGPHEEPVPPAATPAPAPMPADFCPREEHPRGTELLGAGLGLWGLRRVPMVGRERERTLLWRALGRVASEGRPHAVVLRGPAGTGKSRLAQWLCEHAHETGAARVVEVMHGAMPGLADGLPGMLLRELGCVGVTREVVCKRVERILRELGETDPTEWNALAELIAPRPVRPTSTSRFLIVSELHAIVHRFLGRLARDRPLVLWLDDVQWGPLAVELARYTMRRRADRPMPLLLVLTARDEALAEEPIIARELDALGGAEGGTTVHIGPLPAAAHSELVRRLLLISGDLARRVEERTSGNPLFAVHLVDALVRRGHLVAGRGGFALRAGAELRLPEDLSNFWMGRVEEVLERRTVEHRIALELGAALGQELDAGEWALLCERAGVPLDEDLLDQLVRRRFLRRTATGHAFAHGMIRESIAQAAADAGRAEEHHRACAVVLASYADEPGVAARIGRHLAAAGAHEDALAPLLEGAREAWRRGDLRSATALLDVRDDVIQRSALPPGDPRRGLGPLLRGLVAKSYGDFAGVRELGRGLVESSEAHGWSELLPHALHLHGMASMQAGDVADARRLNERALSLLEGSDDDIARMEVLWSLGWVARNEGRLEEARRAIERARELAEGLDDFRARAVCERGLAQIAVREGDYEAARAHDRAAMTGYEDAGDRMGLVYVNNGLGEIDRYRGDLAAAEKSYTRAISIGDTIGSSESAVPRLNLGFLLLSRDRWAEADTLFEEAAEVFARSGRTTLLLGAEMGRLVVTAATGDDAAWDRARDEVTPLLESVRVFDRDLAWCARRAAELLERRDRPERAAWAWALARAQLRGLGLPEDAVRQ